MRALRVLVPLLAVLCAASCGQKGPLYLRDSPPAGIRPPKSEPYKPLPYPKESKEAGEDEAAGRK